MAPPDEVTRVVGQLAAASVTRNGSALDVVLRVKALAHEVGGLEQLKQLVEVLAE